MCRLLIINRTFERSSGVFLPLFAPFVVSPHSARGGVGDAGILKRRGIPRKTRLLPSFCVIVGATPHTSKSLTIG